MTRKYGPHRTLRYLCTLSVRGDPDTVPVPVGESVDTVSGIGAFLVINMGRCGYAVVEKFATFVSDHSVLSVNNGPHLVETRSTGATMTIVIFSVPFSDACAADRAIG